MKWFFHSYAEQTTDARERACADKINAISTAVAHHAMSPLTSPYFLFNADGTSFQTLVIYDVSICITIFKPYI